MVVWEGVVIDAVIDFGVGIACSFGAELPYSPVFAMFGVEKLDEGVKRVAICALGIRPARSRCRNDCT